LRAIAFGDAHRKQFSDLRFSAAVTNRSDLLVPSLNGPDLLIMRSQNDSAAFRSVQALIATAADFANCFAAAVASTSADSVRP
jgi:hypothetical protein